MDSQLTGVTLPGSSSTSYSYTYDRDGNQVSYTDPNQQMTTYKFADPALPSAVTSATNPDGKTTKYTYDAAGNRISLVNPANQTTTYAYNVANELTSISYSDGQTPGVTYSYNSVGQPTTMTDGTGTTNYSYDSLERLTSMTNGDNQTIGYGYNLDGNVTSITYPNGKVVGRTYNDVVPLVVGFEGWWSPT